MAMSERSIGRVAVTSVRNSEIMFLPVRAETKQKKFVGSPTDYPKNVSDEQILEVLRISRQISILTDVDELLPLYQQAWNQSSTEIPRGRSRRGRALFHRRHNIDIWRKVARKCVSDHFAKEGLSKRTKVYQQVLIGIDQIPREYLRESQVGRRTIDETSPFVKEISSFYAPTESKEIIARCPAISVARRWYDTASEVINKASTTKD